MLFKRSANVQHDQPSLERLPNELLLRVLTYLDTPDLLHSAKLNVRFHQLSAKTLVSRITARPDSLRLRAFFEQESRWKFSVDLQLVAIDQYGRFQFAPVESMVMRLFESKFLRSPSLHRISVVGEDFDGVALDMPENLLPKAKSLPLKECGQHRLVSTYSRLVTEMSSTQTTLVYTVSKTPSTIEKVRSGERWVTPLRFECPLLFLCQARPTMTKVMDKLNARPMRRGLDGRSSTHSAKVPMISAKGVIEESALMSTGLPRSKPTNTMVVSSLQLAY
jgi:hypothetical protein